jgi:hypothetical protein
VRRIAAQFGVQDSIGGAFAARARSGSISAAGALVAAAALSYIALQKAEAR